MRNQKKALVTGGAGFIGSNIAEELLKQEWDVRVVDNISSGYKENLDGLDIEFIKGDIANKEISNSVCEDIDVVFHLAACVGRQKSIEDPVLDATTNLIGTVSILEGMVKNKVKKIVYSSSAAIFGELETAFIDEKHPQNADSPYGVTKLAAEKMILAYADIYDITGICLRYFNIYGVNQRYDLYGNVIPVFAERIYNGKDITIFGDGTQTRDFVNVKDIVRANILGATKADKTDVYNLGSGSSITINDLAKKMIKISGMDTKIVYAPKRVADVLHCKANTEKVLEILGFKTTVDLDEGLVSYMKWFEANCI